MNYVHTVIELTGKRETFGLIAKAIEVCNEPPEYNANGSDNNWVGNIFEKLHINTKRYDVYRVFWSRPSFNKYGHLVFWEMSGIKRSSCAEILQNKFFGDISGVNYHFIS